MIHANQRAYYDAINTSNTGSSTVFIEFMLSIIKASLIDDLCNVSAATANRILVDLAAEGKLTKCRINGHLAYQPEPTRNP